MVKLIVFVFAAAIVIPLSYFALAWTFDWWLPLNRTEPFQTSGYVTLDVTGEEGRFEGTLRVDGEERQVEGDVPALVRLAAKAEHTDFSAEVRRMSGNGIIEIALLGCPEGSEPRQRFQSGDEFHLIRCGQSVTSSAPQSGAGSLSESGLCQIFSGQEIVALLGEQITGGPSNSVPPDTNHCVWAASNGTSLFIATFPARQFASDVSFYGADSNVVKLPGIEDEAIFITPKPDVEPESVRRVGAALFFIKKDDDYLFVFLNEPKGADELLRLAPIIADRFNAR